MERDWKLKKGRQNEPEPEVVDRIIAALGLGSSGQNYTSLTDRSDTLRSRYRRMDPCRSSERVAPTQVCLDVTEPHGKYTKLLS